MRLLVVIRVGLARQTLRTVSGAEVSSTKEFRLGVARVPARITANNLFVSHQYMGGDLGYIIT